MSRPRTHILLHFPVAHRHNVVASSHHVGEPLDGALRVAKDDRLIDAELLVEVAQRTVLPRLVLEAHVELRDACQGHLVTATF